MKVISRNPILEFYRVLLMFGIVLLHIAALPEFWGGYRRLAYLLHPCVDGFVFLGGWFGIRFSWKKLMKLYGTAIWCCILVAIANVGSQGGRSVVGELNNLFKECWFLHAYAVLMCLAPLVDCVLDKAGGWRFLVPPLCIIFGWGFLSQVAGIHHYVPSLPGMEPKSGITLLGIYMCARLFRHFHWEAKLQFPFVLAILVISLAINPCGLGWFAAYNSPISVLIAGSTFYLFERFSRRVPSKCCWWINYVTPSIFAIYILHANPFVTEILCRYVKDGMGRGIPTILSMGIVSLMCFGGCLMVDVPRRILWWVCTKILCSPNM